MKRINRLLLYLLLDIYTIGLISRADLFLSNLSGITKDYYPFVLIMGLLMSYTYYQTARILLNRIDCRIFLLSVFLAVYLPYFQDNIILMNLHIISCYGAFGLMNYCLMRLILNYRIYSIKKARYLMMFYIMNMTVIFGIYTYSLCVNGLMEIIFLIMISFIFGIIEYDL